MGELGAKVEGSRERNVDPLNSAPRHGRGFDLSVSRPSPRAKARANLRLLPLFLFWLISGVSVRWAGAEQPPDARALLEQLNQVSIDPGEIYVLRDAKITRDKVNLYFSRGFIGFFTKAGGEITGAAFTGEGEVLLIPPDPVEKRNLARFTQSPILEEQFTSVYMRFTDQTAKDLRALARKPDPEDLEQPVGFLEEWNPILSRLNPDYSVRVLQDLLGDRSLPYFLAQVHGANLGIFAVSVDERSLEAVDVAAARRSHGRLFGDSWCSFRSRSSDARAAELIVGAVRVLNYKIDTQINADNSLEGRAELEVESHSSQDRVLAFELSRLLKVSEVMDEKGQSLAVFQNPSLEESAASARGNDWVVVVLPSPHPAGEKYGLKFNYQGNVITDVGNRVLYVGARGSWYPNRGLGDRATFDLRFHWPARLTLVATGKCVEESSSSTTKYSRWLSDGPFPVAGFNLGAYESRVRRVGNRTIEVYATREAEALLEKRHAASAAGESVLPARVGQRDLRTALIPRVVSPLSPSALLDQVAEQGAGAVEYFERLFGPFPYPRLAISQMPGSLGQGWPELIYLPTLSFLTGAQRSEFSFGGNRGELANEIMIAHEIAHQWWGNQLGWKTYHDQWISEGLASYAAALYLSQEKGGEQKFRELLRGYKRDLLSKTKEGETVESGGPIWLGGRLSNSLNPDGFTTIVYKKASWILHMLRMLMRDPVTGSDEPFFRMLRDFVEAYRGSDPSTEDFIRHAEKYVTRSPAPALNGRLDWFFSEWVYGTGIPTYKLEASARRLASGKFAVQGTIEQSQVPAEFEMVVPIVAIYGKEHKERLGKVFVTGAGARFRFTSALKPQRVAIDEDNLLAVIR